MRFTNTFKKTYIVKVICTYWREGDGIFLRYLNEFPDCWTQGTNLEDLIENLADLYKTVTKNEISGIQRVIDTIFKGKMK